MRSDQLGTDGQGNLIKGLIVAVGIAALLVAAVAVVAVIGVWLVGGNEQSPDDDSTRSQTEQKQQREQTEQKQQAEHAGESGEVVTNDRSIQMGLIKREYLVMSPAAGEQSKLPLVVVLAGLGVDRHVMATAVPWREQVAERRFVAVFPQGFANSWNVGPCCPPSSLMQLDDMGFLDAVIEQVVATEGVDENRIYMTGFSAGALMTYRYACGRPGRLVAIGPMSGVNLTGCSPGEPVSVLHQHSDPDPVIPFDGSPGAGQLVSSKPLPAVPGSVDAWAKSMGCSDANISKSGSVEVTDWQGCSGDARVRLVRIPGLGHNWPKTPTYDGLDAMLDFFGIR